MACMVWMKLWKWNWTRDTAVLSPAVRGVWLDLLIHFDNNQTDRIVGTHEEIARAGRCSLAVVDSLIEELTKHKTADVTVRSGIVTIICRRMSREKKERESARKRKLREREKKCHASVTENVTPPSRHRSRRREVEVEEESGVEAPTSSAPPGETPPLPNPPEKTHAEELPGVADLLRAGPKLNRATQAQPTGNLLEVRNLLLGYMLAGEENHGWRRPPAMADPPDIEICRQVLAAAGGAVDDVREALLRMRCDGMKPETSWAYFPASIGFMCGRRREAAS